MQKPFELPEPSDAAMVHSRRLADYISSRIQAAGGWIDFSRYMDMALYAPGLGYYSAGSRKFGPGGDFVTAPEISPLFARCLARACAPYLAGGKHRVIIELGAGTGLLAAEMLNALMSLGVRDVRYLMLEVSADLRERQHRTLREKAPEHIQRVQWLDTLPAEPLDAILIANEVADALPASRFCLSETGVLAQGVMETGRAVEPVVHEGFCWATRPADAGLTQAVRHIESGLDKPLAPGYVSELCPGLPGWVAALGAALRSGLVLICDYGMSRREYYHPQRRDGTLSCHYRHRVHADPFFMPGLQDITAWVDFTAVAEAAEACGLEVMGYTTQAHFLLAAGMDEEMAALADQAGVPDPRAAQQARTLLLPGEMGERFKVMALCRNEGRDHGRGLADIAGFGIRDLRHML